jgi:hypothetical protein
MIVVDCPFDPPHTHEFPDDWFLGGASGTYFGSDPRWRPTTYIYLDDRLHVIHESQVPLCDEEAIDRFTNVGNYGPLFNPVWLQARRPDGTLEVLPVEYDKSTDVVRDTQ